MGAVGTDVTMGTNPVVFAPGEKARNIQINVTSDNVPELDEIYFVVLQSVDNNGEVMRSKDNISFTVRYV